MIEPFAGIGVDEACSKVCDLVLPSIYSIHPLVIIGHTHVNLCARPPFPSLILELAQRQHQDHGRSL